MEINKMTTKKILCIDNNPLILNLVRRILDIQGFHVLTAHTGQLGVELAEANQADLIILDIMMPEMNGHEVIQAIRAIDYLADIPIIVLSASDSKHTKKQAFELGATDYIVKPFSPMDLEERINACFTNAQKPKSATQPLLSRLYGQNRATTINSIHATAK
jgi:DNA-binding response OmpR family regulator